MIWEFAFSLIRLSSLSKIATLDEAPVIITSPAFTIWKGFAAEEAAPFLTVTLPERLTILPAGFSIPVARTF